jgi:toxin ParE1/3/4
MAEEKGRAVKISITFLNDIQEVFWYGRSTFGKAQAENYEVKIWELVESLTTNFMLFPECRYLPTKSKMYRWIILDAHRIIYRIKPREIQVLRILHSARSIRNVKAARTIKI